jgi:hypothetical protein
MPELGYALASEVHPPNELVRQVDEDDVAEQTPHGPDPQPYLELIGKYADAGFTHVYVHQIGDNQDAFAEFAAKELIPRL